MGWRCRKFAGRLKICWGFAKFGFGGSVIAGLAGLAGLTLVGQHLSRDCASISRDFVIAAFVIDYVSGSALSWRISLGTPLSQSIGLRAFVIVYFERQAMVEAVNIH